MALILGLLAAAAGALLISLFGRRGRAYALGAGVLLTAAAGLAISRRRGLLPGARPRPWRSPT